MKTSSMRRRQEFANGTWIESEEVCYPDGAPRRHGRAMCEDGKVRAIRAGIADTWFSIPARVKVHGKTVTGFVTAHDVTGILCFYANRFHKNVNIIKRQP